MKTWLIASRTAKEILRDPLNLAFGLGFPLIVLFLLSALQANIPVSLFELDTLTPGIAVFGLSFMALFSGMLLAKDRTSSFLMRLFASPLTAYDFITGYALPFILIASAQSGICFLVAGVMGLELTKFTVLCLIVLIPASVLFIGIGLLCGSVFDDKVVGGLCGALLTNLSAWLSGTWFDLELVGGPFKAVAEALPFVHAVNAARAALAGETTRILPELVWVFGYAGVIALCAVLVFHRRMTNGGDRR